MTAFIPHGDATCYGNLHESVYAYYFVWRKHENVSPCTGSRVNTNYERFASWDGCQRHPSPPTFVASVLTSRPWPVRQKNGLAPTGRYHTLAIESILGTNYSPLGCLHLALARRYYFVWRKHEIMSLCTGSSVNINYDRIASGGGCQCWTGDPRILETHLVQNYTSNLNRTHNMSFMVLDV